MKRHPGSGASFGRRIRGLGLMVLVTLAAVGPSPADADAGDVDAAWAALAAGGRLALIRHAEAPRTGDPPGLELDDCTTQRNLSNTGRNQARALGRRFRDRDILVERVLSGQWCRCLETAELMALGAVEQMPALNSFFDYPERRRPQMAALRVWVATTEPRGAVVLVTHQVVISALAGVFARSGEIVVEPSDDGTVRVIGRIPPP